MTDTVCEVAAGQDLLPQVMSRELDVGLDGFEGRPRAMGQHVASGGVRGDLQKPGHAPLLV